MPTRKLRTIKPTPLRGALTDEEIRWALRMARESRRDPARVGAFPPDSVHLPGGDGDRNDESLNRAP